MITFDDLKFNFRETYKTSTDADLNKNEEMLYREFSDNPPEKLEKIWKSVRRYHKTAFYPSIGQILEAMDKGDVKEFAKSDNNDKFYNKCTTCGCCYSLRSRLCPDCNRPLEGEEIFKNDVEIIKSFKYSPNHVTCQDNCSICPNFKSNRNVRGAKCSGWGKTPEEKETYNCVGCPCKTCCDELCIHDTDHEVGVIMKYVKSNAKDFTDPNWIRIYKENDIRKDTIYNYAGKDYQNITGFTEGRSPLNDSINWKRYTAPKNEKGL